MGIDREELEAAERRTKESERNELILRIIRETVASSEVKGLGKKGVAEFKRKMPATVAQLIENDPAAFCCIFS